MLYREFFERGVEVSADASQRNENEHFQPYGARARWRNVTRLPAKAKRSAATTGRRGDSRARVTLLAVPCCFAQRASCASGIPWWRRRAAFSPCPRRWRCGRPRGRASTRVWYAVPAGTLGRGDMVSLDVPALDDLAVSLYLPENVAATTQHAQTRSSRPQSRRSDGAESDAGRGSAAYSEYHYREAV